MLHLFKGENNLNILKIAVVVAIIAGLIITFFLIISENDSYSALYIIPKSVIHDPNTNVVFYTYGVKSLESGKTDYVLDTYLNNTLIKTKQFSLNKGEILDERDKIVLPADVYYPSKIRLELTTSTLKEEVHFWLTDKS